MNTSLVYNTLSKMEHKIASVKSLFVNSHTLRTDKGKIYYLSATMWLTEQIQLKKTKFPNKMVIFKPNSNS